MKKLSELKIERIRKLLKEGLRQQIIATRLGITQEVVSHYKRKWERGNSNA